MSLHEIHGTKVDIHGIGKEIIKGDLRDMSSKEFEDHLKRGMDLGEARIIDRKGTMWKMKVEKGEEGGHNISLTKH